MEVLVIGGGVIGVCAAYSLLKDGFSVSVVDQGDIGAGCSKGNAGLIVPSHAAPLARPGIVSKGLRWMLDSRSPFFVKPGIDPALLSWLWRFRKAATERQAQLGMAVLQEMALASRELTSAVVAAEGIECDFLEAGLLQVFLTERAYQEAVEETRLPGMEAVPIDVLDGDQVRILEPAARPEVVGGIHYLRDASLDPEAFVHGLTRAVRSLGGVLLPNAPVQGFDVSGGRIERVKTAQATLSPDIVVLAAGAWTPALARRLGVRIPIQPAKGYSLTYAMPAAGPSHPLYLGEAWVAVTPLGARLRFAGTLELGGMSLHIDRTRLDAVASAPQRYLDFGEDLQQPREIWSGLRPATPDGLPIIGRPAGYSNLIVAAGHAMLGMTLGLATGKLVADLACERQPVLDLHPLRVERF